MFEPLMLVLAGLAGLLLGGLFFGGLWWTVTRGLASPYPEWWFLVSQVTRLGLASAGFYLVSGGHWDRLVACLCGFLMARGVVLHWLRLPEKRLEIANSEASHAP